MCCDYHGPYTERALKTCLLREERREKVREEEREGGEEGKGKEERKEVSFVQMHWNGIHDIQIPSSLFFN